jgi:enterochelin esterase-like enzyme
MPPILFVDYQWLPLWPRRICKISRRWRWCSQPNNRTADRLNRSDVWLRRVNAAASSVSKPTAQNQQTWREGSAAAIPGKAAFLRQAAIEMGIATFMLWAKERVV